MIDMSGFIEAPAQHLNRDMGSFSVKEEENLSFDKLGFPCQIRMVESTIVSADGKSTDRQEEPSPLSPKTKK